MENDTKQQQAPMSWEDQIRSKHGGRQRKEEIILTVIPTLVMTTAAAAESLWSSAGSLLRAEYFTCHIKVMKCPQHWSQTDS